MEIVFNNTVLVNFSKLNNWELIEKLFNEILITSQVFEEVKDGIEAGYDFMSEVTKRIETKFIKIVQFPSDKILLFEKLLENLDYGEASCIAYCFDRESIFFTDDFSARRKSKEYSINISGTLGILIMCINKHILLIKEANDILRIIIDNGYRSPISSFNNENIDAYY